MASRANAALPPSKRHHMPELRSEPVLPQQPVASGSRHPALPAETWTTVFPDHFRNYRQVSSLSRKFEEVKKLITSIYALNGRLILSCRIPNIFLAGQMHIAEEKYGSM
jgi:hypothetical protein